MTNNVYNNKELQKIIKSIKSNLLNKTTKYFSIPITPFKAKNCKILTKTLSKKLHINILVNILFSIILILSFKKYTIQSKPEKNIEQTGRRIPDILSP